MEMKVLKPEESCLDNKLFDTVGHVVTYLCDKVEYTTDRGILVYYKDCKLPRHGFPFPEAILAINVCKRSLKMIMKFVNPIYALIRRNQIIGDYLRMADNLLSPCRLKEEYLCPVAKESKKLLTSIFTDLKIDVRLADVLAHLLEYDDAYRLFFQDIMNELSREELLEYKTYWKIKKIVQDRATKFPPSVILPFFKIYFLLLFIPKIKKAIRRALRDIDFEKFKFDDCDYFWTLNRDDWNFGGQTWLDRHPLWVSKNGGKEPQAYQY